MERELADILRMQKNRHSPVQKGARYEPSCRLLKSACRTFQKECAVQAEWSFIYEV